MQTKLGIFKPKLLLFLAFSVFIFTPSVTGATADFSVNEAFLHLSTGRYEIAFERKTGGLIHILDLKHDKFLSRNQDSAQLWGATFTDGKQILSPAYQGSFTYKWNSLFQSLTLHYKGTAALPLDVTIEIRPRNEQCLQLQAKITNNSPVPIQTFQFPTGIKVATDEIRDALLPMIPGVRLQSAFFTDRKSFSGQYPGVMFADYVALRTDHSCLALYSQQQGRGLTVPQPVQIGFSALPHFGWTRLVHDFKTWIGTE